MGYDAVEGDIGGNESFHQEKIVYARVGEGDLQFRADHIDLIDALVGFENGHGAFQRVLRHRSQANGNHRMRPGHGHQLVDGAADDQFSALDDAQLVTEFAQLGEDVAGDHDGFAEALKLPEQLADFDAGP